MPTPAYDDTYTGPRWRYGLHDRAVATARPMPPDWIIWSNRAHPGFQHGTVDFTRELTPDECAAYQIEPLGSVATAPQE